MEKRKLTMTARWQALTNAAEFIRGHVETGLEDEDVEPVGIELYQREAQKVYKKLQREAEKVRIKLTK